MPPMLIAGLLVTERDRVARALAPLMHVGAILYRRSRVLHVQPHPTLFVRDPHTHAAQV